MDIRTDYVHPPIPDRRYDWSAIDRDTYDGAPDAGCGNTIGFGRTEQEAVEDLLELFESGSDWQVEAAREYRTSHPRVCEGCGGEGRIFKSRYGGNDPDVWDAGRCEACEGTGYRSAV
ncbi:MAG TPA: hypothetical protein VFE12_20955 [Acetobacteraceae bacterium]|nr:hypothetical protein [Acetobacteraceae bacterium]